MEIHPIHPVHPVHPPSCFALRERKVRRHFCVSPPSRCQEAPRGQLSLSAISSLALSTPRAIRLIGGRECSALLNLTHGGHMVCCPFWDRCHHSSSCRLVIPRVTFPDGFDTPFPESYSESTMAGRYRASQVDQPYDCNVDTRQQLEGLGTVDTSRFPAV